MPVWLDEREMAAWRSLLRAHSRLMAVLDHELHAEHGISLSDYEVLVHLSEGPDAGLRMTDLAARLAISRSGMTRRLDGLVAAGLVERRACPSDRRGTMAMLTRGGRAMLRAAAPTHVAGVRRHLISRLDANQLELLAAALEPVAAALECASPPPDS